MGREPQLTRRLGDDRRRRVLAWLFFSIAGCSGPGGLARDAATGDASLPAIDARVDAPVDAASSDARPDVFVLRDADPCPATECGPPTTVTSADEMLAIVGLGDWDVVGRGVSGCVSPTRELVVRGRITLDVAAVNLPGYCNDFCRSLAQIEIRDGVAECVERPDSGIARCRKAAIADTTVRVLRYVGHYGLSLEPVIELIPSCASTVCRDDERLCTANQVCWLDIPYQVPASFHREHCLHCLGLPDPVCACWDGEGPVADGTACHVWLSGDVGGWGMCSSGVCR